MSIERRIAKLEDQAGRGAECPHISVECRDEDAALSDNHVCPICSVPFGVMLIVTYEGYNAEL